MLAISQSDDFQSQATGIKFCAKPGDKAAISHTKPPPIDPPIIANKDSTSSLCKPIKNILMDQTFICGLGNIYVNEVLFLSKIHPLRNSKSLNNLEIKQLVFFIKKILVKSISLGGSTIKDFHNSEGKSGFFQDTFKVYAKEGSACSKKNCRGIIKKIVLSSRASFFCDRCQKE